MKRVLPEYRLHEHTEALFLLTLGLITQVLDGSPLDLKSRWDVAWQTEFPREYFSVFAQTVIKSGLVQLDTFYLNYFFVINMIILMFIFILLLLNITKSLTLLSVSLNFTVMQEKVLSIIIFIRCLTSAFYILFGLVVVFCILRESSPKLMLPWLFISGLKSVLLTFLETLMGMYVCSALGKIRKPCMEFIIAKAIELFFAIYLWVCIRSIHKDFERYVGEEDEFFTKAVLDKMNFRRRRARSMIDESTLYKTAKLNAFQMKDVPNIIFEMLKTEEELPSQDSLFTAGMMLTSVSNMGSYDYLRTTLSLGELGNVDLSTVQVAGLDDDRDLTPYEKALNFLRVTPEDVAAARHRRQSIIAPPQNISMLVDIRPSTIYDRIPREKEIYIGKVPTPERVRKFFGRNKKMSVVRVDLMGEVSPDEELSKTSEEFISMEDGKDDDVFSIPTSGEITPEFWFMTSRKSEDVSRFGLFEQGRSENYKKLLQLKYMTSIGPEVFDRESKLVRLTSISDLNRASRKFIQDNASEGSSKSDSFDDEPGPSMKEEKLKKKKIAFEQVNNEKTAMPLSVIVTNLPIMFDSRITESEAVYYKKTIKRSNPVASSETSLQTPSRCSITEEASTSRKSQDNTDHSKTGKREKSVDKEMLTIPLMRSTSAINFPKFTSHQWKFVQNLMKTPIKEVLKYYKNLRELDKKYSKFVPIKIKSNEMVINSKEALLNKLKESFAWLFTVSETSINRHTTPVTHDQISYNEEDLRSYYSSDAIYIKRCVSGEASCLRRSHSDGSLELTKPYELSYASCRGRLENRESDLKIVYPPPALGSDSFCSAQDEIVAPDGEQSLYAAESEESFSLFYSKNADLTSPLLDMSRFIYPDHIHYSYKNVKKKGFDVEFNGALPLLMRDLNPLTVRVADTPPDPQTGITRRPMDLTFARLEDLNRGAKEDSSASHTGQELGKEEKIQRNDGHAVQSLDGGSGSSNLVSSTSSLNRKESSRICLK